MVKWGEIWNGAEGCKFNFHFEKKSPDGCDHYQPDRVIQDSCLKVIEVQEKSSLVLNLFQNSVEKSKSYTFGGYCTCKEKEGCDKNHEKIK